MASDYPENDVIRDYVKADLEENPAKKVLRCKENL